MKSAPSQEVQRERSAHPLPSQRCSCTSGRAPFCTATPWQQLSRALIAANHPVGSQPLRNPARPSAGTASSKPKAPFMKWKSKSGPLQSSIRIPPGHPTNLNLPPPWTPPAALPSRAGSCKPRVSRRPASRKHLTVSRSPCAISPTPVMYGPACAFKQPSTQILQAKSSPSSSPGIRSRGNSGGNSSASPLVGAICPLTDLSFHLNIFSRKNCGARQPSCRFSFLAIPLAPLKVNPFDPDARETAHSAARSWHNVSSLESTLIEPRGASFNPALHPSADAEVSDGKARSWLQLDQSRLPSPAICVPPDRVAHSLHTGSLDNQCRSTGSAAPG